MVEQTKVSVDEHNIMLVRCLDALFIHDTPRRRCKITDTTSPYSMDVVREGEECITRACHSIQLLRKLVPFFFSQQLRDAFEQTIPLFFLFTLDWLDVCVDEQIDCICTLGALHSLFERESEHSRVVAEPPSVGLRSSEPRAVNTRLLACT